MKNIKLYKQAMRKNWTIFDALKNREKKNIKFLNYLEKKFKK
jgi:hypothetical protein